MTFLAPIYLAMATVAAIGIVALHLITRDRPPRAPLPTARFVPARIEKARSRATRPADPFLLVVRVLLVLLAGAAFARPVLQPERRAIARVVVLDASSAVADPNEARDSALALLAEGDALVIIDSSARIVAGSPRDSLGAAVASERAREYAAPAAISAALLAARRGAYALRDRADSVELVLVTPLVAGQLDAATAAIRAHWRGRARLVAVRAAESPVPAATLDVRAGDDDPLRAAALLLGPDFRTARPVRVVRAMPETADSAFASGGGVLVVWPVDSAPGGWTQHAIVDTVGGVIADGVVLIAPFERRASAPEANRVVARWVDGEPAAVEQVLGDGCVRDVAVPLDAAGDLALRAEMRRLLATLAEPCGGHARLEPATGDARAWLAGTGPLASVRALAADDTRPTPLVPWLLGAALLAALAEPIVRHRGRAS